MSDRAATNTKFNRLLQGYRQEILTVVQSEWETLDEEQRTALSRVNNHFCGLHLVVNLAEQCNAVLLEWEKATLGNVGQGAAALSGIFPRSSESGTLRLVRTACKALQKHGNEQSIVWHVTQRTPPHWLMARHAHSLVLMFTRRRSSIVCFDQQTTAACCRNSSSFSAVAFMHICRRHGPNPTKAPNRLTSTYSKNKVVCGQETDRSTSAGKLFLGRPDRNRHRWKVQGLSFPAITFP